MDLRTVSSAIEANERTKSYIVSRAVEALGGSLAGKKVTVWGLAYKAKTEDYRDSPSVEIVNISDEDGKAQQGLKARSRE
jgi:UDPglucose 6-dehydrogenase